MNVHFRPVGHSSESALVSMLCWPLAAAEDKDRHQDLGVDSRCNLNTELVKTSSVKVLNCLLGIEGEAYITSS